MKLTSLLSLTLVVAFLTPVVAAQLSPTASANEFYRTYLAFRVQGLPDVETHKALLALLDPGLRKLFAAARVEQAKAIKEHPDEKPPWIEGDLFSSLFEGAQSFKVGAARVSGTRAEVDVTLHYKEGDSVVDWTDTLVLIRGPRGWLVSDIVFKGNWQFKNSSTLRSALRH